jgi:EpsI family protein
MQKSKIFALISFVMVLTALAADHTIGRLPLLAARKAPVERFPKHIQGWTAGPDNPVDPEIQKTLATATVVDRNYTNPSGQSVQLLLVSASQGNDVHNPMICFPGQGWQITDRRTIRVDSQDATVMTAKLDETRLCVLYWISDAEPSPQEESPWLRNLRTIRRWFVTADEGRSLLVRVTAPGDAQNNAPVISFVKDASEPLRELIRAITPAAQ